MSIKEFLEQGKPSTTTYDGETYTLQIMLQKKMEKQEYGQI